jgi:hypothetical protein
MLCVCAPMVTNIDSRKKFNLQEVEMQTVHIGIMLNWNNNKKHIHNHMLAMLERQVALCDHKRVFMFVHLNLLFRMMKMCKINWLLLITTRTIVVSRRTGMKRGCQMTKLVVYQWSVCHLNCFLERKKCHWFTCIMLWTLTVKNRQTNFIDAKKTLSI